MTVLYTSTASDSLGGTAGSAGLVQIAFDQHLDFQLRAATLVSDWADKSVVDPTNPGKTATLQTYQDLPTDVAGAMLDELVDPDSVKLATPTKVDITEAEMGRSTIVTRLLSLFSLKNVDMDVVNIVGQDLINTIDAVAMAQLILGTNVMYAGSGNAATADVTASDTITSNNIRDIVTELETQNALYRYGETFLAGIHTRVANDLRKETGGLGWLVPQQYGASQEHLWNGTLGLYEGVNFIKSNRMHVAADGTTGAKVYRTLFIGSQAFARKFSDEPHIVIGETVDRLKRFRPVGWLGTGGFKIYRNACLYRLESGASTGN